MAQNTNIGQAFPLEKLGSDIARNEFNYQAILNGLIEWNKSTESTVNIRLTKDSDPWYEDFSIPTKNALFDLNAIELSLTNSIPYDIFAVESLLTSSLYGGSFVFKQTTFDSNIDVDITTNDITVEDATNFSVLDEVVFEISSGGTFPGGLSATSKFVISFVSGNVINLYQSDGSTPVDITSLGSGIITIKKIEKSPEVDSTDPGDNLTFRFTVKNDGDANWELYYYQLITTWASGKSHRFGNVVLHNGLLYKIIMQIDNSTTVPSSDSAHFETLIKTWTNNSNYTINDLVKDSNDNLYRVINSINSSTIEPEEDTRIFKLYAEKWTSGDDYTAGSYVFYNNLPYIAKSSVTNSTKDPSSDTKTWEMALILPVTSIGVFDSSNIFKWQLPIDISKFVMKNVSAGKNKSTSSTDISLRLSVRTKEPDSIYQRSVDTFVTSNYSFWPTDKTSLWDVSKTIKQGTDTTKPITERQDYSAVMVFDHTDPQVCKTINYINYDGPDLDQGLCLFLPIQVQVGESCIAVPEDGFTYEFYFRIWPNVNLTDDITRDHIVNKSQIYVYSAPTIDDIKNNTCGTPIAKFSMARTTTFYVFGENISIPDKQISYRATFIYSSIENKWITLDYYQLPDHIFIGPVGFIDPQSPANLDLNSSVIGNINPNASNIGYETGAFPLYQDPFSKPDLSPFKISGDTDLEDFKNRII